MASHIILTSHSRSKSDSCLRSTCGMHVNKRRRTVQLAASALLICYCITICSAHSPIRPGRTRRRNNTGFYYGLRDDDMNFHESHKLYAYNSNVLSRSFAAAAANSVWKGDFYLLHRGHDTSPGFLLHRGHDTSPGLLGNRCEQGQPIETDNGLNPNRLLRNHHAKRKTLIPSLRQNAMQSLLSKLQNHQLSRQEMGPIRSNMMASILNRQRTLDYPPPISIVQTAVKSKSKQQRSKKKRRKNNTGFYYGIREDVFEKSALERRDTTFSKPSSQAGAKPKQSTSEDLREKTKVKVLEDNATKDATEQIKQFPPILQQQQQQQQPNDISEDQSANPPAPNETKPKRKSSILGKKNMQAQTAIESKSGVFDETLQELRAMKDEIIALREELRSLKGQLREGDATKESHADPTKTDEKSKWWARPSGKELAETPEATTEEELTLPPKDKDQQIYEPKLSPRLRRREFEQIGRDVETWACRLLFDQENKAEDGWKEIECNKFCRKKFNPDGRTQVFLKWMPDSRNDNSDSIDEDNEKPVVEQDFPCIKCYSTIDAPMDKVCSFLSNENTIPVYNELVDDYCDVEEITPHSKITWCKMPRVMMVKSRDFVTYCSHRWWRDGTQVIVNQACEHEDKPGILVEGEGDACRGYALRGANFISKDPDDPNKTRIALLAHADPGGGLPQWVMTTAVNAVVQIEPFKLFHNINQGVSSYQEPSSSVSASHQLATVTSLPGRSNKPAGMAQMGYVCFWPNGGGLKEKHTEDVEVEGVASD
ncbi:hypothetical protein ACHAWO_000620 [Cyclotella atomus]|uniref:START domain-containing protein n=1 Tax=Cyclotella atomus TaxID=382360 RepID=A0ABD3N5U9_9STRA